MFMKNCLRKKLVLAGVLKVVSSSPYIAMNQYFHIVELPALSDLFEFSFCQRNPLLLLMATQSVPALQI